MKSLKNLICFFFLMVKVIAEDELSKCPDLKPMADLDMQKIVKDTWNVQYLYAAPSPNNKSLVCMTFEFKLRNHNKDIEITEERQYGESQFYSASTRATMTSPGEVLIKTGFTYSHVIFINFLVFLLPRFFLYSVLLLM